MSELKVPRGQSGGSAKRKKVIADLNSAVVREIIAQLNQQEIPIAKTFVFAGNGTQRQILGCWRHDAWIKDVRFFNASTAALANAATDILLRTAANGDVDMEGGPTSPSTVLDVEGFAAHNMPAQTGLWGDEFDDTVNCDAVTDKRKGFIVRAGETLYAEVINTEGAAAVMGVEVVLVNTDRIDLQPGDLQVAVPHRTQHFHVADRGEE